MPPGVAQEDTLESIEQLDTIVSADDHVSETVEDLLPHIDNRYSGIKKFISNSSDIKTDLLSVSPPLPPYGIETDMDIGGTKLFDEKETVAETKLNQMDQFDIEYSVVDPGILSALPTAQNDQVAAALANGYNSWILEELEDSPRLKVAALAAGQKPDHAAEEIDRLADEDDVVGVQLGASGHIPPLSREWYDPIYQAAQDNDLPVMFHSSYPAMSHSFPLQHRWNRLFTEEKVIGHPFSHMWNLTNMIYEGVPERFPDLDFVFQEAGIGWIPYWTWRLDDYYLTYGDEMPAMTKLPSEYIKERFYFTSQPVGHTAQESKHLAWALEMAGPDSIMFSADLPHSDFDTPDELFDRIYRHFDAETVRGVMGETAMDVFGIEG